MAKKTTTIRIEEELIKKAKELGIEISKSCERALRRDIEALEGTSEKPNCGESDPHPRKGSSPILALLPNSSSIRISSLSLAIRSPPTTPVLIIGHPQPTAK